MAPRGGYHPSWSSRTAGGLCQCHPSHNHEILLEAGNERGLGEKGSPPVTNPESSEFNKGWNAREDQVENTSRLMREQVGYAYRESGVNRLLGISCDSDVPNSLAYTL